MKADADGPGWTDAKVAEALGCRAQAVENVRERLVTSGFEVALSGRPRDHAPRPEVLGGEQEAQVLAMRLGPPPDGFANWSLRLLAEKVVELKIVPAINHETAAWHEYVNGKQRGVDWQFQIDDARAKLKSLYPKIKT